MTSFFAPILRRAAAAFAPILRITAAGAVLTFAGAGAASLAPPGAGLGASLVPPVVAAPRVAGETAIPKVPGQIIAWRDTTYLAVSWQSVRQVLHNVNVSSGNSVDYVVGKTGRGVLAGISPDGKHFLATETDSLGRPVLQIGTWPYLQWMPLFPVSDADPHVTWYPDSRAFLYQDVLDDSLETPSLFQVKLGGGGATPKLFLLRGQRPLLAPTGDAVVCVGTDSLAAASRSEIEEAQPVGLEDFLAGGFRWVAPLQTYVPTRGAWSPDGSDLALVGYGTGNRAEPERRVYLFSRRTGQLKRVVLPGDFTRKDGDHAIDAAVWSPDGRWIAVGRPKDMARRGDRGGVWLINRPATQVYELKPKSGVWQGAPLWIAPDRFVIGDGAPPDAAGLGQAWIVQVSG